MGIGIVGVRWGYGAQWQGTMDGEAGKWNSGRRARRGKRDRLESTGRYTELIGKGLGGGRWGVVGCIYVDRRRRRPSAVGIIRRSDNQLMYNEI